MYIKSDFATPKSLVLKYKLQPNMDSHSNSDCSNESCSSSSCYTSSDCWMFSTDSSDSSGSSAMEISPPALDLKPVKRGRVPLAEQFPELVPEVSKFIEQHSSEAHNRRRDATSYSHGVTLTDIQAHIQKTIPGLESISKVTIHRLMQPARANSLNARRHLSLVDARVPGKQNNKTKDHPDFHFTCAAVRYLNELAFICDDECIAMSCDDKNKINVGTLAVSRHFQIKRFFSQMDTPNYPDHDFPHPNSKLIPSGYMVMSRRKRTRSLSPKRANINHATRRSRSLSPEKATKHTIADKSGRRRVNWPRTGPLTVYLQATKFHNSTSQSHACHLFEMLEPIVNNIIQPKSVVTIIADGGPDWSSKSTVNLVNYGRVWRDLNLDGLILTAYAPGHSRFNPIERLWAPLSQWLTGVTLPISLDGENLPPYKQAGLSDKTKIQKEKKVFDNAINECQKYWQNKTIDSFPVKTKAVSCHFQRAKYFDHNRIKQFVNSSASVIRAKRELRSLQEETIFLHNHCSRQNYQLAFLKCQSASCDHCSVRPVRAHKFFDLLSKFGGKLPSPVSDGLQGDSYLPLLHLLRSPQRLIRKPESAKMCPLGCDYLFLSKADRRRHTILCHSRK